MVWVSSRLCRLIVGARLSATHIEVTGELGRMETLRGLNTARLVVSSAEQ